jgi:hypothetical protein
MKYLGNVKNWIDQRWIDRILTTPGDPVPIHQPLNQQGSHPKQIELYDNFCKAGFDKRHFYVNMYTGGRTKDILDLEVPVPPIINVEGKIFHWWFIKTMPGQLSHWHFDPHCILHKTAERYWVALHDYVPGQIFVWEGGNILTDFVAGDVYQFDYAALMHGTANISMTPRYSYQLTVYDADDRVEKKHFYTEEDI